MSGIIKVEPRKKTESPVKVNFKTDIDSLLNVKKDCYAAIEKMEEQTEEFKAETQTALNQIDLRLAEADTNIKEAKKAATDAKEIAESLAGVEARVQGITDQAISDMNDIKQATEDIKADAITDVTAIKDQAIEDTNAIKEATEEIKLEAEAARDDAIDAATLSESWAKGGTGTRVDEDTNNAKYWAEKAAEVAKVEIATTERAGIVKPDGTTIEVETDGTIRVKDDNYVPASEKGAENGVATLGADGKVPSEQLPLIGSDTITYGDSNVESELDTLNTEVADRYTKTETNRLLYGENLLDNSDFKINQRGGKIVLAGTTVYTDEACTEVMGIQPEYEPAHPCKQISNGNYARYVDGSLLGYVKASDVVDGYATAGEICADAWGKGPTLSPVRIFSDGVTIGGGTNVYQYIDNADWLLGKTVTLTAMVKGVVVSGTTTLPTERTTQWIEALNKTFDGGRLRIYVPPIGHTKIQGANIQNDGTEPLKVEWVSLIPRPISAPYIHPNPTLELLKCKARMEIFKGYNDYGTLLTVVGNGTSSNVAMLPIEPKRTTPTIRYDGAFLQSIDGTAPIITNIAIHHYTTNLLKLVVITDIPLTMGHPYYLNLGKNGHLIVDSNMY